jgi:ribosome-binding factor A
VKARMLRINDEITRVASEVIRKELADPRIGAVVSIIRAETTQDLKFCKL